MLIKMFEKNHCVFLKTTIKHCVFPNEKKYSLQKRFTPKLENSDLNFSAICLKRKTLGQVAIFTGGNALVCRWDPRESRRLEASLSSFGATCAPGDSFNFATEDRILYLQIRANISTDDGWLFYRERERKREKERSINETRTVNFCRSWSFATPSSQIKVKQRTARRIRGKSFERRNFHGNRRHLQDTDLLINNHCSKLQFRWRRGLRRNKI